MLEVEAKLRLQAGDADRVRERLRRLGALRGDLEVQKDTYFAHPQREFAKTDEALRLRSTQAGLELTYKGPRQGAAAAKTRREETVHLRDDPTAMLQALGFKPAAEVHKRRDQWTHGGCTIALDTVDGLGDFVEVEVMGNDVAEANRRIDAALHDLGLEKVPRISASYLEMLQSR